MAVNEHRHLVSFCKKKRKSIIDGRIDEGLPGSWVVRRTGYTVYGSAVETTNSFLTPTLEATRIYIYTCMYLRSRQVCMRKVHVVFSMGSD